MKNTYFDKYPFNIQNFTDSGDTGDNTSADAGQESTVGTESRDDSEFLSLIKGKYKDAFARKTQTIINRRFRETKNLEEFRDKAESVFSILREKYGTEKDDLDSLISRLKEETEGGLGAENNAASAETAAETTAETAADETSSETATGEHAETTAETAAETSEISDSPETSPSVKEETSQSEKGGDRSNNAVRQYANWQREAAALSGLYPGFDLGAECKDGRFLSLLVGGASVKSAYEAVHHDEIMKSAMEHTAKVVSEALSRSMNAGGARPFENGLSSKSAINPTKDVNSLTDSDIAEILKQVAAGKVVRF